MHKGHNIKKPLQSYIRKECISTEVCQSLCDKIQDFAEQCLVRINIRFFSVSVSFANSY